MTTAFRKLSERVVYEGHFFTVVVGTFEDPDGNIFEREIVRHPGAVTVVPLLDDGRTVLLVRQYRASIDELLLELPAGKLDVAGEAPEAAAARELEEEIGKRAGKLERLARVYNTPGFTDERGILYLATELSDGSAAPHGPEESHMTVEEVSLDDVPAMIDDGRISDGKTIIGLLLTRQRLGLSPA